MFKRNHSFCNLPHLKRVFTFSGEGPASDDTDLERRMKHSFFIGLIALSLAAGAATPAQSQTARTPTTEVADSPAQPNTSLIESTEKSKATAQELLQLREAEVGKLTASVDQLRQLYAEGLIARLELEKSEQDLAAAKARVEETHNQIANWDRLVAEMKKAEELAKVKRLVKPTLLPVNFTEAATVLRSPAGSWSIANLGAIQQFFSNKFGHALPTTAIGQSATHDRLGYDHRNAVDVGLHPDSPEGRALISFLQNAGIPFLAFRSAIPGVATGPHIHIGSPSHRLA